MAGPRLMRIDLQFSPMPGLFASANDLFIRAGSVLAAPVPLPCGPVLCVGRPLIVYPTVYPRGGNPLSRSLLGVKRTWAGAVQMSAFDPKRTSAGLPPYPFRSTGAGWYDALS